MPEVFGQNKAPQDNPNKDPLNLLSNELARSHELTTDLATKRLAELSASIEERLMKKGLRKVMNTLGINSSYDNQRRIVDKLLDVGIVLFNGRLNPYTDENYPDGQYIGTPAQQRKLKRQIIKNRHLFKGGKLSREDARRWER